ncbi:hypothetical protein L596_026618 [Steinernema carpocapsae]|uniref:Uncharacterized protein n=1 Tax=Steinernema carpocapsae TaxID=34508 RepID=A0A4U5M1W3_STECR|nr:hypothetical protein L596_026618 [Steinernema carpocapsae]
MEDDDIKNMTVEGSWDTISLSHLERRVWIRQNGSTFQTCNKIFRGEIYQYEMQRTYCEENGFQDTDRVDFMKMNL